MTQHIFEFDPDVDQDSRRLTAQLLEQWDVVPTGVPLRVSRLSGGVGFAQRITGELAAVKRIQSLFETRDIPRGFCHSDLVPQNFLQLGTDLFLVDFDYAGTGWIAFELASFSCQAQLDPDETRALLRAYDPEYDDGQEARVELMRAVAGIREACWAYMAEPILSGSTSPLEGWSYQGYAADNLAQARGVLADGRLEQYLAAARRIRPGALF